MPSVDRPQHVAAPASVNPQNACPPATPKRVRGGTSTATGVVLKPPGAVASCPQLFSPQHRTCATRSITQAAVEPTVSRRNHVPSTARRVGTAPGARASMMFIVGVGPSRHDPSDAYPSALVVTTESVSTLPPLTVANVTTTPGSAAPLASRRTMLGDPTRPSTAFVSSGGSTTLIVTAGTVAVNVTG